MEDTEFQMFQDRQRSNWVRLRTLVVIRWIAIAGQTIAMLVAIYGYRLDIEEGLAAVTIGASVLANLFTTFLNPENKRLSERQATLMMVFDVFQLGALLYLTGGLNNPFALLILAPVTISATVLHLRSTAIVGALAIVVISLLGLTSLPIRGPTDLPLILPPIFEFGYWLALVIGVVFLSVYARQVTNEMHAMGDALLATQLALAREQKLTDLGGVVAAAAHELGTPLATIKLVSSELMEELADNPDLYDDARLIRSQADRCRDILRSMGRAGKDDLHLKRAPLETVVQEAAEPHQDRGKPVLFEIGPEPDCDDLQPVVYRRPEVIHGLRNLVQNAVDFARDEVHVSVRWSPTTVTIRISDDGPGFPAHLIGRIGDPFVTNRRASEDRQRRPGYEGMGLGLFIAKTLLERSGARLSFASDGGGRKERSYGGAIVQVVWPIDRLRPRKGDGETAALGENRPITA
ncbi:sensor histidine kinase RegB [Pelagovum pacificum]|uniref:histidine kinase n=1 Tax=Pelagovum pacificum TaxID=2588711 RepID=A0A5C5GL24_9RHOB|nr:ActS/PrrB/RegB family redox-sensitive histidine kinase [Pelagovum pacificum]QQA42756.1 ActS/PrrB/RegB family redox-sensitive histidine kinase [Pelagovum pacificum]TNY34096.1 ActS/PrrB/RegB family redox-sensitive histidine kinase [Pelagovum pacificum]